MTDEQRKARKNNPNVRNLVQKICNKKGEKDFVFISYKSDDWEIVLNKIVYRLVNEYGLNIYFDGDFDDNNPHWTTQFPENMESDKCKGVLAFIDDKYATSYATLMELMHSQYGCQNEDDYEFVEKPVVLINLEKLSKIDDTSETGLGKTVYFDGERYVKNIKASDEQKLFDEDFERGCEKKVFEKSKKPYFKDKSLTKKLCSVVLEELLKKLDCNDNFYDGNLDGIVNSIRSVCGETVFSKKVEVIHDKQTSTGLSDVLEESVADESHVSGICSPEKHSKVAMVCTKREKGYPEKCETADEMDIVSEVQGTDLKEIRKYPFTKGSKGRVKVSYAWSSEEYGQYLSMRGQDKEFELLEGNAIGIRAFYQFMLWFMVNKGVEIGSKVYGIDKHDVDKNGKNRGLRKWKDVLCVTTLNEDTKRLIGVETFPNKYLTDEDGDLCVYVGGSLINDNIAFAKMFSELETTHDISDYILYFGGSINVNIS